MTSVVDREFVFIIGSFRSGTTWLQIMLDRHPDVVTVPELTVFDHYLGPAMAEWRQEVAFNEDERRWEIGLPGVWSEADFRGWMLDFIDRVYGSVLGENPEATHILDKRPDYGEHVDLIHDLLPQARFIHLIRDGRDVAISFKHATSAWGLEDSTLRSRAKGWSSRIEACRRAARFEGRYLEVKYEDLLASCPKHMEEIFGFCGLELSSEEVAKIVEDTSFDKMRRERAAPSSRTAAPATHYRKGKAGTWQEEFTPLERYWFEQGAGDRLRELGYAQGPWWAESRLEELTSPLRTFAQRVPQRVRKLVRKLRDE